MHLILRNEHSYTITKNERIQLSQYIGFSAKVKKINKLHFSNSACARKIRCRQKLNEKGSKELHPFSLNAVKTNGSPYLHSVTSKTL